MTDQIVGYRLLYSVPLRSDDLVLVMLKTHPLACRDSISLRDVKNERFCFPREDVSLFKLFYETCTAAGFSPKHTLSDVRLGTIKRYILAGMRLTIQTRIRARNFFYEPEFKLVNIEETPCLTLTLMANKNLLTPIGWQFIQYAREFFDGLNYDDLQLCEQEKPCCENAARVECSEITA